MLISERNGHQSFECERPEQHGLGAGDISGGVDAQRHQSSRVGERADHLIGNGNASISATLAAAYAEAGRFPNAAQTAKRALQLATEQGNTALADAIRAQIRLYHSGFPYRYNSQTSFPGNATQQ